MIHSDLKASHILVNDDGVFFIDFGYACGGGECEIKGFTAKWTSVDALLLETVHELDDYEAVFTSALVELKGHIIQASTPSQASLQHRPVNCGCRGNCN